MHFLQNPQKVHPALNTRAGPGTGSCAPVGTEQRLALLPLTPIFSVLEMEGGWTRNPPFPCSEDVAGTAWEGLALPGYLMQVGHKGRVCSTVL